MGRANRAALPMMRVRNHFHLPSGGLRFAATTGYYLTAFQAEIRSLPFHTARTGHNPFVFGMNHSTSLRSRRQHKAQGVAKRNPGVNAQKISSSP